MKSEKTVEVKIPETIVSANVWLSWEAAPAWKQRGSMPAIVVKAVATIGLSLRRHPSWTASDVDSQAGSSRLIVVTCSIELLTTIPTRSNPPRSAGKLIGSAIMLKAITGPVKARGIVARTVIGHRRDSK